jgi:hypothetical protein
MCASRPSPTPFDIASSIANACWRGMSVRDARNRAVVVYLAACGEKHGCSSVPAVEPVMEAIVMAPLQTAKLERSVPVEEIQQSGVERCRFRHVVRVPSVVEHGQARIR